MGGGFGTVSCHRYRGSEPMSVVFNVMELWDDRAVCREEHAKRLFNAKTVSPASAATPQTFSPPHP
jgi:hypothetical protein